MSSTSRKHSRTSGFSLVEALVALAIAALLAVALTRFYGNTRANAARIGEVLQMTTLSETLISRLSSTQNIKAGLTAGRSGIFGWRILITPVGYTAVAREISEPIQTAPDQTTGLKMMSQPAPAGAPQPTTPIPKVEWIPYRVAVIVEAPSGRKHATDTIRIGPAQIQP